MKVIYITFMIVLAGVFTTDVNLYAPRFSE